jgi:hypothetical protein
LKPQPILRFFVTPHRCIAIVRTFGINFRAFGLEIILGHPEGVVAAHALATRRVTPSILKLRQQNDPNAPLASPAAAATGNELPR